MEQNDREYKNKEITVSWKPKLCIHATTCYKELIEVFNPGRRPWVNMEGAPTEKIIEVVNRCPTKALAWKWNNPEKEDMDTDRNKKEDNKTVETTIQIMKDGPIVIQGDFKIVKQDGTKLKKMSMTSFCRCGHSNNMPFCDGTHRKKGFYDK